MTPRLDGLNPTLAGLSAPLAGLHAPLTGLSPTLAVLGAALASLSTAQRGLRIAALAVLSAPLAKPRCARRQPASSCQSAATKPRISTNPNRATPTIATWRVLIRTRRTAEHQHDERAPQQQRARKATIGHVISPNVHKVWGKWSHKSHRLPSVGLTR